MALIQCVDCGNDVSTEAKACPRCGRPPDAAPAAAVPASPAPSTGNLFGGCLVIVLLLSLVGFGAYKVKGCADATGLTEPDRPAPPSSRLPEIGTRRFMKQGFLAASSEDELGRALGYLRQGDQKALKSFLAQGRAVIMPEGAEVEVLDVKVFSGTMELRRYGTTVTFWSITDSTSENPPPPPSVSKGP